MIADDIRRVLGTTPRARLCDLAAAMWKAFAAGAIPEEEAQQLAELIEARKVVPVSSEVRTPRRVGSRPRTSASLERRRSWAAASWMPPSIAAGFTQAEAAALAVIIREVATTGRCGLPIGAIAARAGVCATSARNAVREARARGILHVEVRRVARDRNLPNLITITGHELALWVKTRARIESQGGAVKFVSGTTSLCSSSLGRPSTMSRFVGQPMKSVPPRARWKREVRGGITHSVT